MPRDNIFSAGSLAKAYVEIADWYGKHTEDVDARTVLTPFCGFGRMSSAMAREGVQIDVCDFQRLTSAIVEGVFAAPELMTNVDKPRFHKGKACAGKLMRDVDQYSAGFIDWVVAYGTDLDIAAIGMAIPGQSMRGWIGTWTGNFESLYKKFCSIREDFKEYIYYPGTWSCYEADFFKIVGTPLLKKRYDVLAIDPPRLNLTQDAYSTGWRKFNDVLGGTVRVRPWTGPNYFDRLRRVLDQPSDYILFTWTEGQPPLVKVRDFVLAYGELEDEQVWESHSKTIHGWRVKRT